MVTVDDVRSLLEPLADPASAPKMAAYMKDHFPFMGVPHSVWKPHLGPLRAKVRSWKDPDGLLALVQDLWTLEEREYQYVAIELLEAGARYLRDEDIRAIETLIVKKAWWDSVDMITNYAVSPMVKRSKGLLLVMDEWAYGPQMWLSRSAILHQLKYKREVDSGRLFGYCRFHAESKEFFIQKAMGWALREYAKVSPNEVLGFLQSGKFPALTVREATKHLKA